MASFSRTSLLGVTVVILCIGHVYGRILPCFLIPMCRAPPLNCRHLTDERGCPTCELTCENSCGPPPACAPPPPNCRHKTDNNGCLTCALVCDTCPPAPICASNCRRITAPNGCQTCLCLNTNSCGPPPFCPNLPEGCRYRTDSNGCPTCDLTCKPCGPNELCPFPNMF